MGYYINVPANTGKAKLICELHGARPASFLEARAALTSEHEAPICVIHNGFFEAAAFVYSEREWQDFHDPDDTRKREYVIMSRSEAERLTGYDRSRATV